MSTTVTLPAYGWKPRADQLPAWRALESGKKLVIIAGHRRWGKDALALAWMSVAVMQRVGSFLYCLPEYSQARRALFEGIDSATGRTRVDDAFPPQIVKRKDSKTMLIEFINGSTLQFVGSDSYDGLVGGGICGLVMSEYALANPAAYAFLRPMLTQTDGFAILISSPRGRNHMYKMVESHRNNPKSHVEVISAEDTSVFTKEQLAEERHNYISENGAALGNSLFSQEFLADFNAATIGGVFTAELTKLRADGRYAPCLWDPRYPVDVSWDLGVADSTIMLMSQTVGSEIRIIDVYEGTDVGLEHYAQVLARKPYTIGQQFLPHDARNRDFQSGTSRIDAARKLGMHWTVIPAIPKTDQIALGCQLLNRCIVNASPDLDTGEPVCGYVMEMLTQYHFKWDPVRKVSSSAPVHDYSSHLADAFMLLAVAKAKDTGFARASSMLPVSSPTDRMRIKDIMARNNNRPTGLWG